MLSGCGNDALADYIDNTADSRGFIDAFADSIDIANVLKLCLIFPVLSIIVQVVLCYYVKVEGTKIEELGERYGLSLILINVAEKSEFGAGLDIYMGNFK